MKLILHVLIWIGFCTFWEYGLNEPKVSFCWIMLYGYFAGRVCDVFSSRFEG
jgi:hypothetical protein